MDPLHCTGKYLHSACLAAVLGAFMGIAGAATVNYPGVTAPYLLASGDTLNVNSGNMQTTNSTSYTVQFNSTANGTPSVINILSGATLSYAGTNSLGSTILSNRNDTNDFWWYINQWCGQYFVYCKQW